MPSEKAAKVEEKVATEAFVNNEETANAQQTDTQTDATTVTGGENPFAIIEESTPDVVAPLPKDETIGEDVWERGREQDHESLEDLKIKKSDYDQAIEIFRTAPGGRNGMADTVPDVIRKELGTKTGTRSNEETQSPNRQAEDIWQAVDSYDAETKSNVPEIPAFEPNSSLDLNVVPTLPNVQGDDDDPFGLAADEAAEQFGQTTGAAPETTPSTTTPSTAPTTGSQSSSNESGLDFDDADFWDETGDDFGLGNDFGATETPAQPGREAATERPSPPREPSPTVRDMAQGSGTPPGRDDLVAVEPMTAVEEYLVNEAAASPVRLMESVERLYKLGKPLIVRRLLRQFLEADVTADDSQQISKRVSPAVLVRISVDEQYQPEGAAAVRKIVEGSKGYFESREVIVHSMRTLLEGTDRQKEDAMRTILNGGETSIEYLLERLAASNDRRELGEVAGLLRSMGESARRALQESLLTSTPLGMRAARLLTQMGRASDSRFLLPMMFDSRLTDAERREVTEMVRELSKNVPSQEKAASTMFSMATNYFRGKVPFMTDANHNVPVWVLREGAELPKFVTLGEADASRYFAEKFARFATALDPRQANYRQLWLVTFFDLKGAELGSDNSIKLDENLLRMMVGGLSVDEVDSALRMAMQQDHPIAARVAAELMGEFGDVEEVIYKRGSQGALVRAAGFSDRRVRFAALRSIMKLNPDRPYPGSSVVTQSLVYFTRATGKKRAIVVCPWVGDATAVANLLGPLGYTTETATMGRQAMQLAIDSADTELMMLDVRTPSSNVEFLVQDMRADNRTHDVPIAVMASGWRISRAERAAYGDNKIETPQNAKNRFVIGEDEYIVEGDMMTRAERAAFGSKMAHAFPRPYDEASAKFVIDNLLRESGVEHVPPQLRLAEAKQSILWVVELYQQPNLYRFENIEQIAHDTLWEPELMLETLELVELIPTAASQQMMSQIVSTATFPLETRQAALKAFENNARNYGILIRGRQVLGLYDSYNASGSEPVASQEVRSSLLDVVEEYANYMQNVGYAR